MKKTTKEDKSGVYRTMGLDKITSPNAGKNNQPTVTKIVTDGDLRGGKK